MGQTGSGEDRQLLAAHQRVQTVDGRNTGLDEFLRVVAGCRVHRQTVDVVAAVGQNLRAVVNGAAEAVENTPQHVFAYAQFHRSAEEAHAAVRKVDAGGAFKKLHQRVALVNFQHLAAALFTVCKFNFRQLVIRYVFNALYEHQRTCDLLYGSVFLWHQKSSLFSMALSIC